MFTSLQESTAIMTSSPMGSIRRKGARERIWILSVGRMWVNEKQGFFAFRTSGRPDSSQPLPGPGRSLLVQILPDGGVERSGPKGFRNPPKFQERSGQQGKGLSGRFQFPIQRGKRSLNGTFRGEG